MHVAGNGGYWDMMEVVWVGHRGGQSQGGACSACCCGEVCGGILPPHGRPGIQFKHGQHPLYRAALVGRREMGASNLVRFERSLDAFRKFCWGLNAEQNGAFQSGPKLNVERNGAFSSGRSGFEPQF